MLAKQKIWLAAGVVSAAAGAIASRGFHVLRGVESANELSSESGEAGERTAALGYSQGGEEGAPSASAEGGEKGERGTDDAFEAALKLVFAGEGGQGGLGISPLMEHRGAWSFTVPALTELQLQQALKGNSLRTENHFAVHFAPDGRYRGWALAWARAPMAQCPGKGGLNYGIFDEQCWVASESRLDGSWTVMRDQFCLKPSPPGVTGGAGCVRAALILDNIVFFGPDGKMIGKGSDLVRGENVARARSE